MQQSEGHIIKSVSLCLSKTKMAAGRCLIASINLADNTNKTGVARIMRVAKMGGVDAKDCH